MGVLGALGTINRNTSLAGKVATFVFLLGIGGAGEVMLVYRDRGPWYAENGVDLAILGWMVGASLAVAVLIGALLARVHPRRRLRLGASAGVGLALCLVMTGIRWFFPAPTVAGANAAFEMGDVGAAESELVAAEARGVDPLETAALRARIRANYEARAAQSPKRQTDDERMLASLGEFSLETDTNTVLKRRWENPDNQALAQARVLRRAQAQLDAAWLERDAFALRRIAEQTRGLDPAFTRACELRGMFAEAESCLQRENLPCVAEGLKLITAKQAESAEGETDPPALPLELAALFDDLETAASTLPSADAETDS